MENKLKIEEINIKSTHIHLKTDITNHKLPDLIANERQIIQETIDKYPPFKQYDKVSLTSPHKIINLMINSSNVSDTGPMASVAGSISQICIEHLNKLNTKYSIIENGGDIALKTNRTSIINIYAGKNDYYNNLAFKLNEKKKGYGICTSSGTFGHSKSFGVSDATIVFSKESSIADGLATRLANCANGKDNEEIINNVLEASDDYREYYDGIVVIKDDLIAKNGRIPQLVTVNNVPEKECDVYWNYEIFKQ